MGAGRRALRVLLFNLIVLAAGLLIVELALGQWLRPANRIARLNLIVDKTISFDVTRLYRDETREAIYRRDRFGFRGSYPDPGRIDILTIGGSTTDQRYITEGKTWQDLIAREFRKAGKSVSVVNAGVDGQSTYGHIKNFDWWFPTVPHLRAKYVLFYVGINDLYVQEGNPKDALKRRRSFLTLMRENSALYYLGRTLKGISTTMRHGVGHKVVTFSEVQWTTVPRRNDYLEITRDHLDQYEERLKALLERSRRLGWEAICATQATRYSRVVDGTIFGAVDGNRHGEFDLPVPLRYLGYEINGVDHYHILQMLNRRTLDVCRNADARTIDVAGEVRWEEGDFYNWSHLTPRGTEKLGHYLYANLSDLF